MRICLPFLPSFEGQGLLHAVRQFFVLSAVSNALEDEVVHNC